MLLGSLVLSASRRRRVTSVPKFKLEEPAVVRLKLRVLLVQTCVAFQNELAPLARRL